MKKECLILFAILLCIGMGSSRAHAQDYRYKIKVVLVNGNIVNGYLAEPWTGGGIHLQLSHNSFMKIDSLDIKKVRQVDISNTGVYRAKAGRTTMIPGKPQVEKATAQQESSIDEKAPVQQNSPPVEKTVVRREKSSEFRLKNGWFHHLWLGLSFGEEDAHESLGVISGYRFGERFAVGAGVNFDRYYAMAVSPVYIEPRFYLKNDDSSLYLYSNLGYGFAWKSGRNNDYQKVSATGGLMGGLGIGYQLNFAHSALTIGLGYKLQKTQTHTEYFDFFFDAWGNPVDSSRTKIMDVQERRLNRNLALTLGIVF